MLGRCSEAIQEGKRACEILPYTKDSWVGPTFITYLGVIYAACGEKEAALQQLKTSAELPVGVSYGELKQSPDWDSLRGDPRFEKIVESLAPKERDANFTNCHPINDESRFAWCGFAKFALKSSSWPRQKNRLERVALSQ